MLGGYHRTASMWPPEHMVGRIFALIERNSPPPLPGIAPPAQWGNPNIVTERLASHFEPPFFARGAVNVPALSLHHFRYFMEKSVGPFQKLVESLARDPQRLSQVRAEFDAWFCPTTQEMSCARTTCW